MLLVDEENQLRANNNNNTMVMVIATLKVIIIATLYTAYGYLNKLNYPSLVLNFLVLLFSSLILIVLQRPWKIIGRLKKNQWILIAILSILNIIQTTLFFVGLKYIGPIRAVMLTEYSNIIYKQTTEIIINNKRSNVSKKRGVFLIFLAYILMFFDSPVGEGVDNVSPFFDFGLLTISSSKVGYFCLIISGLLLMVKDSLVSKITGSSTSEALNMFGNNDSKIIVGQKSINALSTILGTIILFPFALFSYTFATDVKSVGYWFHFVESIVFIVIFFSIANFYLKIYVRSRSRFSTIIQTSLVSSVIGGIVIELFGDNVSITGLTIVCLILLVIGQYLMFQNPSTSNPNGDITSTVITPLITQLWVIIKQDKDARNIFIYLSINLLFMFVELSYGFWNNSLGLISDAFHMLFDCIALLIGLFALVIADWKPNRQYTFGYGRVNVLSGFINSIFLVFIAFSVLYESFSRFIDPPEVTMDKLLPVSIIGLLVNLIGLFVFHEAHHAAHGPAGGGHSHSHSHSHSHNHSHNHDHDHEQLEEGHHEHHGHDHGHGHDETMWGVWLHILGDTLGSVGVIVSSSLIYLFGWQKADPICSLCIALIIFMSCFPLLKSSANILLHKTPDKLSGKLQFVLDKVCQIDGVEGYNNVHFWNFDGLTPIGTIHLNVLADYDQQQILSQSKKIFLDNKVKQITIQLNVV
eukprot:TRINITY_DN9471_c0_g1_i1.p1 TRINITY_DN9471_c0_g1~~TRINITY_DN9471_c0_g1_i1.p1  ORF type:complete len:695 (-),score=181.32 TRINITY_DN9471_c0_g1_i1:17-2101(-)